MAKNLKYQILWLTFIGNNHDFTLVLTSALMLSTQHFFWKLLPGSWICSWVFISLLRTLVLPNLDY